MNFSDRGVPILSMEEKLDALEYCLDEESWEDVAGHLCDLLAHVGSKMQPNQNLRELIEYYGKSPTPIKN